MKDVFALLDGIHLAFNRPEYNPEHGTTHCNQFVDEVCRTLGFKELNGKLANDIVDFLSTHPQWQEIKCEESQSIANAGGLIVAGLKDEKLDHGHVCIICPGKEKPSGRWGLVPSCASVGIENTIGKGINWSFMRIPQFWVYRPTL